MKELTRTVFENSLTAKLYICGFDPQSPLQPWLFHRAVATPGGQLVTRARSLIDLEHTQMSR